MKRPIDIGDRCVECMQSVAYGTGKYVNRVPHGNAIYEGYICVECAEYEEAQSVQADAMLEAFERSCSH